jgi:magnesium transporter
MGQVVNCAIYRDGKRLADLALDALATTPDAPGQLIWVGLLEPDEAQLQAVQRRFGLHELAIEDAHRAHQRPKLEVYGDTLFLVLRTAQLVDGKVEFGETYVFVGRGHVVTVRHGASASFSAVRQRCEAAPQLLRKGEDFILYTLLDFVVDNFFPAIEQIEDQAEKLEDDILDNRFASEDIPRVYELRRTLQDMRHALYPLLDICNRLMRFDVPLIDRDTYPYFRDVQDHVIQANETIEGLRELSANALEAHLLLTSLRQNEVTKKLAAWAAILAVPTAIAGVYGMNFDVMPELRWVWGYPAVIGGIVSACCYLYYRFRKAGWI